jgi:hypothetical protein
MSERMEQLEIESWADSETEVPLPEEIANVILARVGLSPFTCDPLGTPD